MIEKDLNNFIKNALIEDVGDGDHSSLASIPKDATSKAHLLVKDNGIIAGIAFYAGKIEIKKGIKIVS